MPRSHHRDFILHAYQFSPAVAASPRQELMSPQEIDATRQMRGPAGCMFESMNVPVSRIKTGRVAIVPPGRLALGMQFYSLLSEKSGYPKAPISGRSKPAISSSFGTRMGVIRLLTLNHT